MKKTYFQYFGKRYNLLKRIKNEIKRKKESSKNFNTIRKSRWQMVGTKPDVIFTKRKCRIPLRESSKKKVRYKLHINVISVIRFHHVL